MTIRRMKTYTGEQGYVYQYYFVGKRATSGEAGTEFIFDVTADRKSTYAVTVVLPEKLVRDWSARHGRDLTDAEQYGAVKMRLFQGFDEIENMIADGRRLVIEPEVLESALTKLGVA
jgi:hypothetical protein